MPANEEGKIGNDTPFIRQDARTCDGYKRNSAPPTKWISKTSPGNDQQHGCTAVTDELSTISGSTSSQGHDIIEAIIINIIIIIIGGFCL